MQKVHERGFLFEDPGRAKLKTQVPWVESNFVCNLRATNVIIFADCLPGVLLPSNFQEGVRYHYGFYITIYIYIYLFSHKARKLFG